MRHFGTYTFCEFGARVGNFLTLGLNIEKELESERKKRKNPRFAYLACSVEQILELAKTGRINFTGMEQTYIIPASEISPKMLKGSDIAQTVINHPSQTEKDTVVAIVNEQIISRNRRLAADERGTYLVGLNQLEYFDLAGIQIVSDKAERVLAPLKKEVLYLLC